MKFILGDGKNLPFKNKSFDLVILPHVLEHIPSKNQVSFIISESLRVSKNGILIALPLRDSKELLLRWMKYLDIDHLYGLIRYKNKWIYHSKSFEGFLKKTGYKFKRSQINDRVYILKN